MYRCSIVIRAFNEGKNIGRLLRGISEQTVREYEIILVDSGSTDDTKRVAHQYSANVLKVSRDEFSFGRSLNIGCAAARGEFIVAASAHVYPIFNDWLEKLLSPFSDPHVALAYGKQSGTDLTKYSERQVFAKWFPEHSNSRQKHPFCNNANAAIRRCLWEKLPYDETLTGLEDLDWAKRAMRLGHGIAYAAEAVVAHRHDETSLRIYHRYRREAIAYRRIFPEERFSFYDFIRLFLLNMASDYYHAMWDRSFTANLLSIPLFRFMQFWGTYRGSVQTRSLDSRLRSTFYYPKAMNRRKAVTPSAANGRRIDYRRTD
jgi:glycosyltransferase involved in cell wall biosynthesis